MKEKDNIEALFKSTLEHHQVDVDPALWQRIEAGLPVAPPSTLPAGSSLLSKITTPTWLAGSLSVAVVAIVASILLNKPAKENTPIYTTESNTAYPNTRVDEKPNIYQNNSAEPNGTNNVVNEVDKNVKTKTAVLVSAKTEIESDIENQPPLKIVKEVAYEKSSIPETPAEPAPSITATQQSSGLPPGQPELTETNKEETVIHESVAETQSGQLHYDLGQIPNVFTPNGDGFNDLFMIKPVNVKSFSVAIFDRSGKLIHEWNNPYGFWDGLTKNGEKAPEGVYFYSITGISEGEQSIRKKGSITIKR